ERYARLLTRRVLALDLAGLLYLGQVLLERLLRLGRRSGHEFGRQVGVGSDHHESRTVKRVGARREDRDLLVPTLDLEVHVGALRATDPVALHGQDLGRPRALEL